MQCTTPATEVNPHRPPRPCPGCGVIDTPTIGEGAGPHAASLRCGHCGRWLKWHSTKTPVARQQARPPTALQLAYLLSLGDQAAPPGSLREASERIDGLLRRGEVQV